MTNPDAAKFLRLAQGDLSDARRMLELSGFRDCSIGFLLQQAAEKALKAWIHLLGGQAPFSHDLAALMTAVDELGGETSGLTALIGLGLFAVQFRYDDMPEMPLPPWTELLETVECLVMSVENMQVRPREPRD